MKLSSIFILFFLISIAANAQTMPRELMVAYTSQWEGERYDDGRPKVSDRLLERAKDISIEEAWGVLRNEGYENQFEGNWKMIHDDVAIVGRALTAQYMPTRPDVAEAIKKQAKPTDVSELPTPGPSMNCKWRRVRGRWLRKDCTVL